MFRYIARHWRGEFSLAQSYWVNGVLIGLPFSVYFRLADSVWQDDFVQSPTTFIEAVFLPFTAYCILFVWQGVGIWRSAGRRIEEGKAGWSWVARIVVVVNACVMLANIVTYLSITHMIFQAAQEERAAVFTVTDHGSYVVFRGEITDKSARALEALLAKPAVKRLVLDGSNGGFVQPSLRLAQIIKDRDLMVVAIGHCESMCTMLLAAGGERAMAPATIMGFHRPTIIGSTETAEGWDAVEHDFEEAGVDSDFIAKMAAHAGPTDIWEPTIREMIDAGLITRIFNDDSNTYIPARDWCDDHTAQCARTGRENGANPVVGKNGKNEH